MTVLSFNAGANDCWGSSDFDLVTGGTTAFVGGTPNIGFDVRNWIPFTVTLPKFLVISSALIKWVSTIDRSDAISAAIGCEDVDNPSVPTTRADLFARVQTTAKTNVSFAAYSTGTQYSYNITTAVQEILNRSGWAYGNTMAVLVVGSANQDHRRQIATVEHATYAAPILEISFNAFIPQAGMI